MQQRWAWVGLLLIAALAVQAAEAPYKLAPKWTAEQFAGMDALEQAIVRLTNAERAKAKLPALAASPTLRTAARQHSDEMAAKNYFEHASPQAAWRMPWQRAYYAGFWSQQVGENILCGTYDEKDIEALAAHCVTTWMGSPGHRANILAAKWTVMGAGCTRDGRMLYCTQLFGAPIFSLEQAMLTPVTGEMTNVCVRGTLRAGTVNVLVNGQLAQSVQPLNGAFTATVSYPRDSGQYTIGVAVRNQLCWRATLDTTGAKPSAMLKGVQYFRSDTRPQATVDCSPFTGMKLSATAVAPAETPHYLVRDGCIVAPLSLDAQRRFTVELILPLREAPYTIGFASGGRLEDLLFIDTTKSGAEAFCGRRE